MTASLTAAPVTRETLRAAAEALAKASAGAEAIAAALRQDLNTVVAPVYARHRAALDEAAQQRADAEARLSKLLEAHPALFPEGERSIAVDGVRAGYRKEPDTLEWDDDAVVITRLRSLFPDSVDMCIRTAESLVVDALAQLPQDVLSRLGVRRIPGIDRAYITVGLSDVDRLVKTILESAQARPDAEKPKGKVKGKAKGRG